MKFFTRTLAAATAAASLALVEPTSLIGNGIWFL